MTSLRTAVGAAAAGKQLPPFAEGDIGDLARALGLPRPVSLAGGLLPALNGLLFATVTRSSGPMTANFVHGSAQVGLQSNGDFSFRLHAEEAGVTGDNYLFLATLNGVKDSAGATLVLAHTGTLAGTLNSGIFGDDSSVDFQLDNHDQAIADHWDTVKDLSVQFSLHVSTDPFQLTEGVLGGFVLVGLFKIIKELAKSKVNCNWSSEDPDTGEMHQCTIPEENGDGEDPPSSDEE